MSNSEQARTAVSSTNVSRPDDAGASRRILIVEDEAIIALEIESRLIRAGYEVVGIADNRDDAIELFLEGQPDLVLMDINICGTADGIATAQALGQLGDVPVIFLTAFADTSTVERAATVSPYGYLMKPFDGQALLAAVSIALTRHAADMRLRLLEAAVSAATVGILLVDISEDQRRISYVNDAFLTVSGVPREKIMGQRPCFLAADSTDEGVERLRAALDNLTSAQETVQGQRASGESFWSTVSISPVADRSGRITNFLIFHLDVSRELEAQHALAESQRLEVLGQLSAAVAHDFNNVLGAVLAFAELARGTVEDELVGSDLDEIARAAKRGAGLTRRLLNFARRGDYSPVGNEDLSTVVRQSWQMAERLAGPSIKLMLRVDPEPMFVPLDSTSIEQVLLNLVANARDAMPEGGKITVAVTLPAEDSDLFDPGRYARLTVADTGTGMDAGTAERVFDRFFSTKPKGMSTGLGLATSKMLIERAGGTISVRTAPGEGSTFIIDLPLTENVILEGEMDVAQNVVGHANGATCLLVEDDELLRRAGKRVLEAVGFEVVEAANGETAYRLLDALGSQLRLLVCDLALPGVGGVDVLNYARETSPEAALLVITGHIDHSVESLGTDVSTLWKPFSTAALARRALDAIQSTAPAGDEGDADTFPPPRSATLASESNPVRSLVLLIEDDAALRSELAAVLEARGISVIEADTGAAGLAALEAREFQAAVVDLCLPDANGFDILAAISEHDALLPTLVLSGEPTLDAAQQALRGTATALLPKPISPLAFAAEVERAVDEGQALRLQQKGFSPETSSAQLLSDIATTEHRFNESMASLYVDYQPIVLAYDRSIFGYEALMRSRGPYPTPLELLLAAEALDRVVELGRAVRQIIATTLAEHPGAFEPIFVNLHPSELRRDVLGGDVEPLAPLASRIVFELTQRAQLNSTAELGQTLQELRTIGYRFALDDLGEGYAGLSSLVLLNPDFVKLGMSLIRDIQDSRIKRELVWSMVNVCRRIRSRVVAEGVETAAEAQFVRDLGCELLQGFYFSRPAPPFPELVK